MLVLVATEQLQGTIESDYCFTVEGELVTPVVAECCTPAACGCGLGFPGFASSRATTTAMVVDLPHLDERDLRDVIEGALERDGWSDLIGSSQLRELVDEHVECIADVCAAFPVGTVVGRNGPSVFPRSIARAA